MIKAILHNFAFILCIVFQSASLLAQINQEQKPATLRVNKVSDIQIISFSSNDTFLIKKEAYHVNGFNSKDEIYRKDGSRHASYKYKFKNDTIYNGTETYNCFDVLISKTLVDHNDAGLPITYNYVGSNLKNAGAYTKLKYGKNQKLIETFHKRRFFPKMYQYEDHLWFASEIAFEYDSIEYKGKILRSVKLDTEESIVIEKYTYNADGSLAKKMVSKPRKKTYAYQYNDRPKSMTKLLKQDGIETVIYSEKEMAGSQKMLRQEHFFTNNATILSLTGFIKVNKGSHLTTDILYHENGLIESKKQYLDDVFIGMQMYQYSYY